MKLKHYNKLVRDQIPEIIQKQNCRCQTKILAKSDFLPSLFTKLAEEIHELSENPCLEELADVYEVLAAIELEMGVNIEAREKVQAKKRIERGGFEERIFLEWIEE